MSCCGMLCKGEPCVRPVEVHMRQGEHKVRPTPEILDSGCGAWKTALGKIDGAILAIGYLQPGGSQVVKLVVNEGFHVQVIIFSYPL